jgi:hypothetical protein
MRRRGLVSQAVAPRDAWLVMARLMRRVLVGFYRIPTRVLASGISRDARCSREDIKPEFPTRLLSSLSSVSIKEHARSAADTLVDVLYASIWRKLPPVLAG